jgi:hypothetical protein
MPPFISELAKVWRSLGTEPLPIGTPGWSPLSETWAT